MVDLVDLLPLVLGCTAAFAVGGFVKGVVSIGLPMVSLPLLGLMVDVKTAVALLLVPVFLSNLLQAIEGKGLVGLLRRFWLLLVALAAGTAVGTAMLTSLDPKQLMLLVGAFAVAAALVTLFTPHLAISPQAETWLAVPVGLLAGVIGGMSTLFGPVLVVYVIGLRLDRDVFVKAISLLYTICMFYLIVGGVSRGAAGPAALLLSGLAMVPVYVGMLIGRRIRSRIEPERFRRLVLFTVLVSGANMVRQGLGF